MFHSRIEMRQMVLCLRGVEMKTSTLTANPRTRASETCECCSHAKTRQTYIIAITDFSLTIYLNSSNLLHLKMAYSRIRLL